MINPLEMLHATDFLINYRGIQGIKCRVPTNLMLPNILSFQRNISGEIRGVHDFDLSGGGIFSAPTHSLE